MKFVLFVFKKIFVFKNHSCSPLIASVIRVLINIREIRAIRVQKPFVFKNPFVFKKTFVFEIQNQADMQLIMQKLLAMAVSTVMTKLMIVFKVSFFIALIF